MDFFDASYSDPIDLRREIHKVIFGSPDVPPQGIYVVLREFTDTPCPGCFDANTGGQRRFACVYCQGEGYEFTERVVKAAVYAGAAPVYKPGILGTGEYPKAEYGATDPNRYTAYLEWCIYPNFERYTLPQNQTPDKLYILKVDSLGNIVVDSQGQPIRISKWKLLTITPIIGDHGRVEFFELGMEKENVA